jgi:hypothetical protein
MQADDAGQTVAEGGKAKRWGWMGRIAVAFGATALALAVLLSAAWASLALWYRLPLSEGARGGLAAAFALAALAVAVALYTRLRFVALLAYALLLAGIIAWWSTIRPAGEADWAPDVARQVTGAIDGDRLTLTNVRDFRWRSGEEATERWETRSYDLGKLESLDLLMSYWAGPEIAHVIFSFGFEEGERLAWSVEVRRRRGGEFSPVADLFKSNPLIIIAADERDVVYVRSNLRGEDVQLYRLRTPRDRVRRVLTEYVQDANRLASVPEFYNSLTTNCTTTVVKMMRAVGAPIPFDWRLIVNGYLPDYAYAHGALDTRLSLAELRAAAHIDERAKEAGDALDFSARIRQGVPSPLSP